MSIMRVVDKKGHYIICGVVIITYNEEENTDKIVNETDKETAFGFTIYECYAIHEIVKIKETESVYFNKIVLRIPSYHPMIETFKSLQTNDRVFIFGKVYLSPYIDKLTGLEKKRLCCNVEFFIKYGNMDAKYDDYLTTENIATTPKQKETNNNSYNVEENDLEKEEEKKKQEQKFKDGGYYF